MTIKFRPLFLIFMLCAFGTIDIYAQQSNDKYYDGVVPSEFLSDKRLEISVEIEDLNIALLNAAIFYLTNIERNNADLPAFRYYNSLYKSAMLHADMMIEYDFFDHINKRKKQWRTPPDRIFYFEDSYRAIAENIAENNLLDHEGSTLKYRMAYDADGKEVYLDRKGNEIKYASYLSVAERLVRQWMNSPPHRRNILDETFNLLGCACAINEKKIPVLIRCTQNFGSIE